MKILSDPLKSPQKIQILLCSINVMSLVFCAQFVLADFQFLKLTENLKKNVVGLMWGFFTTDSPLMWPTV